MAWKPTFKIFASDGVSLVYTFEHIIDTNWPLDNPSSIEYTNTRASGAITIPEGNKPYNIFLTGILLADDYTALTTKMFLLRDTILPNTRYVLKIDKSDSTYDLINVIRKSSIAFEKSRRINNQKYTCELQALAWS